MKKIILYIYILLQVFNVSATSTENRIDPIAKSCIDQVNYLIHRNEENDAYGKSNLNWYVYFVGEKKEYLESYLSKYVNDTSERKYIIEDDNIGVDVNYLDQLNNYLIEINKSNLLEVYVAFTLTDRKILEPIVPKKYNTLHKKKVYVDSLINYGDKSYLGFDAEKSKKDLNDYSKEFQDRMKSVYEGSDLSKDKEKPNHIMPFTNRAERIIYSKEGRPEKKDYWAISIYLGKTEERFNLQALIDIYNDQTRDKGFGNKPHLKKISAQVLAINEYYQLDIPPPNEYKEDCSDLLALPKFQPLLESRILAHVLRRNPCILKNMGEMGPIDYTKSEWVQELEIMVTAPLYVAILAPFSAEFVIPSLIESIGAERATNAASAMAVATVIETMTIYYWSGSPEQQKDIGKAILGVNRTDIAFEGVKGLAKAPFLVELPVDCIYEGTKLADGINDPENYKFGFDTKECVSAVGMGILTKIGLHQSGKFFKTLKNIAQENPALFIKGWKRVLSDIKADQREAFIDLSYEIFEELGVPRQTINNYVDELKKTYKELSDGNGNSNTDGTSTSVGTKIDIEGKTNNTFDATNRQAKDFPETEAEIVATNNTLNDETKKLWQNHEINVTRHLSDEFGNVNVGRQITVDVKIKNTNGEVIEKSLRIDNLIYNGPGKPFKIIDAKSSVNKELNTFEASKLATQTSTPNQKWFYNALKESGNEITIRPRGQRARDFFDGIGELIDEVSLPNSILFDKKIDFYTTSKVIDEVYDMFRIVY